MNNIQLIGYFLVVSALVILVMGGLDAKELYQDEKEGKTINCYDKFGSKIMGVECKLEGAWQENLASIIAISLLFFVFGGACITY